MATGAREGREKTCFSIWHNDWSNGENIPRLLLDEPKLRNRPPPSRPGKKRRCRDTAEGGEARYSEGDTEPDVDEVEERGDDTANVTVL
ncbi:hypothetical protein PR003_g17679 [Phytophthora rubi]|uniref:Uncharacterized protein n=1 Tax=Phytophthora rubi TaxID=129364 RepID=A0A6A4E6F6_9STRA|nr:hypothetical protein PR002_g13036 [Phytophthora rubi]KAE9320612.1 hypothetical protein PR003_g17679 [Phytophthora rubi]